MKYVLDTCVLLPTILRETLLAVAARGLFTPVWSDRILGEWRRAAARHGQAARAEADIARVGAGFPGSLWPPEPGLEARLHLPDPDDIHVLATAIGSSADGIVTLNAADFPRGALSAEGLTRRDPDGLLWELWSHHPDLVTEALEAVRATAERIGGEPVSLRPLLRRAKLTRLARSAASS